MEQQNNEETNGEIRDKKPDTYEISEDRLEEIRQQAKERALVAEHKWIQRGGYIVCTSCQNQHGIRVAGKDKMIGIENGMPKILKHRS
jgi:hypothetical protein